MRRRKKNKHSDSQKLIVWSQIYLEVPIPHWRHMSLCPPLRFEVESQPEVKHLKFRLNRSLPECSIVYIKHSYNLDTATWFLTFNSKLRTSMATGVPRTFRIEDYQTLQ